MDGEFSYMMPILAVFGAEIWGLINYVNNKFSKAEEIRRDSDVAIHERVNTLSETIAYEKGRREEREFQESNKC